MKPVHTSCGFSLSARQLYDGCTLVLHIHMQGCPKMGLQICKIGKCGRVSLVVARFTSFLGQPCNKAQGHCRLIMQQSCGIHRQNTYSKICVKRPLKNRQNKDLNNNCCLMKVESIAECSTWSILQYF